MAEFVGAFLDQPQDVGHDRVVVQPRAQHVDGSAEDDFFRVGDGPAADQRT
jgi:hypothetical protein